VLKKGAGTNYNLNKIISHNGFGLGEGGELEALSFVLAPKFDRSTKVQFTTEPPLLPNPCYKLAAVNLPQNSNRSTKENN
jgi:hypothetical protein